MKNNLIHILLTLALLILLALLSDAVPFWMPDMLTMVVLALSAVLMLLWAGFVMQENGSDEREAEHRSYAGRAAYLSGIAVLTLGLLIQGLSHAIDPWLPAALSVMIVAKLLARLYADRFR